MSASAPSTESQPGRLDDEGVVLLGAEDLPAACPNEHMPVWNLHPRVFLDIVTTGHVSCPYCGTRYRLRPGTVVKGESST